MQRMRTLNLMKNMRHVPTYPILPILIISYKLLYFALIASILFIDSFGAELVYVSSKPMWQNFPFITALIKSEQ